MIIMDFKGITWVGNVYQKFEAMCLEVEEIIVQDTVKYVENQVHTVGASVKKFYSDVVQDLVPESSVDSVKPSSGCMLHEYAPICSFEKTKENTSKEDLQVIHGKVEKDWRAENFHGLHPGDYSFKPSIKKYDDGVTYKRTKLGAKRISKKENLLQVVPQVENRVEKDPSGISTVHIPSKKDLESSYKPETISYNEPSSEVTRINSMEESFDKNVNGSECVSAVLSDSALTDAVESIGSKESEFRQPSPGSSSLESDYVESNDVGTSGQTISQVSLSFKLDSDPDLFSDDVVSASNPGRTNELTTDSFAVSIVSEQKREILQQLSQKPVEESCILVNEDDVLFVPSKGVKRKPYKKKIRDAISSRLRSGRKWEYELLASANQECVKNPKPMVRREDQSSDTHGMCESDWQLV